MSTKGLKKTFSWRFGPSKLTSRTKSSKSCSEDGEESDPNQRRHSSHLFPFFHQPTGNPSESSGESGELQHNSSSIGFISDILDGVVFAPAGSSELPRPSPDTRSRTNLSSFRGPDPSAASEGSVESAVRATAASDAAAPVESFATVPIATAVRSGIKPPLPQDLETLFQQELAAKIKQRNQQLEKKKKQGAPSAQPPPPQVGRSSQSALPQVPHQPKDPSEFDNPLYQTLTECLSGSFQPEDQVEEVDEGEEEATYADIDEVSRNPDSSIRTAVEELNLDKVYACSVILTDCDAIYENVEEFQPDQTYINIVQSDPSEPSQKQPDVLSALVLDVDSSLSNHGKVSCGSSSSTSGNSTSSPLPSASSSPEQLSPADSARSHQSRSPDSGVFGLLKPAEESPSIEKEKIHQADTLIIQIGSSSSQDLLDQTLKKFEEVEELGSSLVPNPPKEEEPKQKMEDPVANIPVAVLLEMAGPVVPSEEKEDSHSSSGEEAADAPEMPSSPPPTVLPRTLTRAVPIDVADDEDEDLHEAELIRTSSPQSVEDEDLKPRKAVRSPDPNNIGARIVEDRVKAQQRKDMQRSLELGLDPNVGESFEKLELQRHDIIEEMAPKKKLLNSWISTDLHDPPVDGATTKPPAGGVNSESILVRKEETKAFWEGKMQPLEPDTPPQQQPFPPVVVAAKMAATLSPPPGFVDNDPEDGGSSLHEEEDEEQPSLSGDDYASVGSVTVKDGPIEPIRSSSSKQPYFFGQPEEEEEEEEDEEEEPPIQPVERNVSKVIYFDPAPSAAVNPTETLIEREIRLQKEREEAVLRERQEALQALEARKLQQQQQQQQQQKKEAPICFKPAQPPVEQPPPAPAPVKREPVSKKTSTASSSSAEGLPPISPAEIRISEEIRELKEREEELRRLREMSNARNEGHSPSSFTAGGGGGVGAIEDEGLGGFSDPERDVSSNNSEATGSRVESPEAGQMTPDYTSSKFPHQRTQSMDSMSSGHSSGDHGPTHQSPTETTTVKRGRNNKTVMPLEDSSEQEDTPAYLRVSKETPIEREIRIAREREEALRREKGLQPSWIQQPNSSSAAVKKENNNNNRAGHHQRLVSASGSGGNDKRDVQHLLATSIIQNEIKETAEKESELVHHGRILTTSVQRTDSKVAALGDYKTKKKPYVRQSSAVSEESKEDPQRVKAPVRVAAAPAAAPVQPAAGRRNFANPAGGQRGLMEKFILSRGRLAGPSTFNTPQPYATPRSPLGDPVGGSTAASSKPAAPAAVPRYVPPIAKPPVELLLNILAAEQKEEVAPVEKTPPVRRHYATTEEKIQQEFREMQKREEELKLNRSKMFAKSQPNLLDLMNGEDESLEPMSNGAGQLRSAHSISDLLAEEPLSLDGGTSTSGPSVKGARRKSALIAQWESRIQQEF